MGNHSTVIRESLLNQAMRLIERGAGHEVQREWSYAANRYEAAAKLISRHGAQMRNRHYDELDAARGIGAGARHA